MSKNIEEIDDAFSVKLDMCITDGIIKSSNSICQFLSNQSVESKYNLFQIL